MNPSSASSKTFLVTGINGYIGSHIGLQLLQKGYSVRGTVRSISKAQKLVEGAYKGYLPQLKVVEVPEMSVEGAFDDAVKGKYIFQGELEGDVNVTIAGVTSIIHTASPLNLTLKTRDETIRPAVQGTSSLLNSAHNCAGTQLNSIVVTGSVASVMGIKPKPGKVYTEADFDKETVLVAEQAGEDPSPSLLYYTSKILAEEAVWKFVSNFNVSCTLPPPILLGNTGLT